MKEIPKNCRECGDNLKVGSVDADKIKIWHPDSFGGSQYRLDSPFNEKTGERNEAETRTCPNWKTSFLWGTNAHDKIIIYKGDLHYL